MELVARLLAEIGAVDEEEDAPGAGVLDEAIGEGAGGEGLARAGGHLDERARAVSAKDFSRLVMASTWQSRMPAVASGCAKGICARRARSVSGSAATRASVSGRWKAKTRRERGCGIALVAEEGFDAGGLVEEGKLCPVQAGGEEVGQVRGVVAGLVGDGGERGAFLLGLDDADGWRSTSSR